MSGALIRMLGRPAAAGGGGTWTSAYTATLINDSNGWNGFNFRVRFNAAALSDIIGSQVRVTLGAGSTEAITISEAWVGLETGASGSFQFTSPVQLKWATATSKVITANATAVSDGAVLAINGASDVLVLAMFLNGGTSSDMFKTSNAGGNVTGEFKSGASEASLTGALSGYSGTTSSPASLIEFLV